MGFGDRLRRLLSAAPRKRHLRGGGGGEGGGRAPAGRGSLAVGQSEADAALSARAAQKDPPGSV